MRLGDPSAEGLLDELLRRSETGDLPRWPVLIGLLEKLRRLVLLGALTGLGLGLLLTGTLPELLLTLRWVNRTGLLLLLMLLREGLPELLLGLRREDLTGLRLTDFNGDLLDEFLTGL